jgi:hypothetical protein
MPDTQRIGRVSTESVHKGTRKHWDEWLSILDKAGATTWTHRETTAWLKKRYRLSPWWQQGVAIGYELARGKRVEGQNSKGEYQLTVTKSLHTGGAKAWKLLVSGEGLAVWLRPLFEVRVKPKTQFETEDGFFGEFRTMRGTGRVRRIRLSWSDPEWGSSTYVQLTLVDRPKDKSILVFDHGKIKDVRIQTKLRRRWRVAADAFAELVG